MNKKIVITTGGSGGHIICGTTIAKELINLGWKVYWIGIKDEIESDFFIKNKINIYYINIKNYRKLSFIYKILFPINLFKSIFYSLIILNKLKPDVVLGLGNYISLPSCLSSKILNIKLIIHEQNVNLGTTNKILSYISNKTLKGLNINNFNNNKYIIVGNPIRKEILNIKSPEIRLKNRKGPIRILILGGSQGSDFINYNIPKIISNLNIRTFCWHQSGKGKINKLFYNYKNNNINKNNYHIDEFIYKIHNAYNWADILICRSGALTVSEISCVGIASILIPIVYNNNNHQYFNALKLFYLKSAKIINQNYFNIKYIVNFLNNINRRKILFMSINSKKAEVKNPLKKIIYELEN